MDKIYFRTVKTVYTLLYVPLDKSELNEQESLLKQNKCEIFISF